MSTIVRRFIVKRFHPCLCVCVPWVDRTSPQLTWHDPTLVNYIGNYWDMNHSNLDVWHCCLLSTSYDLGTAPLWYSTMACWKRRHTNFSLFHKWHRYTCSNWILDGVWRYVLAMWLFTYPDMQGLILAGCPLRWPAREGNVRVACIPTWLNMDFSNIT